MTNEYRIFNTLIHAENVLCTYANGFSIVQIHCDINLEYQVLVHVKFTMLHYHPQV